MVWGGHDPLPPPFAPAGIGLGMYVDRVHCLSFSQCEFNETHTNWTVPGGFVYCMQDTDGDERRRVVSSTSGRS